MKIKKKNFNRNILAALATYKVRPKNQHNMNNFLDQFTFTTNTKDPQFKKMILGGILAIVGLSLFFGVAGYFAGKALYYFTH